MSALDRLRAVPAQIGLYRTTQRAVAAAERVLDEFRVHHTAAWRRGLAAKLGLPAELPLLSRIAPGSS